MTFLEEIADLKDRIARAHSERDTWRASGLQEKYLEAHSRAEALELQLERLQPQASALPAQASISYNGRHYHYGLYRYDQLADAIAYARQHPGDAASTPPAQALAARDQSERELMDSLAITFRDGVYHLGDYRYDRLADAVNYARLRRTQGIRGA